MPTDTSKAPKALAEKPQPIEEIQKELDEVTRQKKQSEKLAAEYLERLQRLQADMENLQKITKRQLDAATTRASERLLVKLLPILDALQQAENIAHSNNSLPPDEIAVGLRMLHKQLTEVLYTEGLEEIPAVGHPLDTERHEVVSYLEAADKPEDIVVEEVRKGYLLNGKVIRPSLVVVTKPKAPTEKSVEETGGE